MTFNERGGIEALSDPDCDPVLEGGLALRDAEGNVLIVPECCSDLGDVVNWKQAANLRSPKWEMLWIGHPWISVRFEAPWLVLSGTHESDSPTDRWGVCPDELHGVVKDAQRDLEHFAAQVATCLPSLGFYGDAGAMSQTLAGLIQ